MGCLRRALLVGCLVVLFAGGASPLWAGQTTRLQQVLIGGRSAQGDELRDLLILRNGRALKVSPGLALEPGDILSTGQSTVVIVFPDAGAETILGPGSQLDIKELSVRATLGRLFVKLKEFVGRDGFKVETRFGTAGAEGTMFDVYARSERVVISVFEGRVRVRSRGEHAKAAVLLEPEQAVVLSKQVPPEIQPLERGAWQVVVDRVRKVESALDGSFTGRLIPDFAEPASLLTPEQIREAQILLFALGYRPVPVDGVEGAEIRQAVGRYRRDQNLPGVLPLDEKLLERLRREWEKKKKSYLETQTGEADDSMGVPAPPEGKVYGKEYYSIEELRDCAVMDIETAQMRDALTGEQEIIRREKKKLAADLERLKQRKKDLDRNSRQEVEAFEAEVDKYEKARQRYNKELQPPYKRQEDAYNELLIDLKRTCRVDEEPKPIAYNEDLKAVMKSLGMKRFTVVRWEKVRR